MKQRGRSSLDSCWEPGWIGVLPVRSKGRLIILSNDYDDIAAVSTTLLQGNVHDSTAVQRCTILMYRGHTRLKELRPGYELDVQRNLRQLTDTFKFG